MKNINDLIKLYSKEGERISYDVLYKKVIASDSSIEKRILAEFYISNFDKTYANFLNEEYAVLENIIKLDASIEQTKQLLPDFSEYHELKAKVYEMFSWVSTSLEEQINYHKLCIEHYRKQLELEHGDNDLWTDFAEHSFKLCKIRNQYDSEILGEIKSAYVEALHIEHKENKLDTIYGFEGSSTESFLVFIYSLLFENLVQKEKVFQDFLSSFKTEIKIYAYQNPVLYYYWANSLLKFICDYEEVEQEVNLPVFKENIESELKTLAQKLSEIKVLDSSFRKALGQLFEQLASRFQDNEYQQIAKHYYEK
ncbi:MAG: hypothetical protein N4A49_12025 [Marinifilaceae bacterium]|jgi:hypothetical protein|nr:hypothetical protein [Marinifilaceae bacterium]